MKYDKDKIIELRTQGLSVRAIQKKLGISSPSVVQHHINHQKKVRNWLRELVLLPERFPDMNDKESELLCAGFNEYRRILLERINNP